MAANEQSNGEMLIRMTSQHWMKYLRPVFVYLLLTGIALLLFVLAGSTAYHSDWLSHLLFCVALVLFLTAHHWFFMVLLSETSVHIIVTNQRVVWMRERLFVNEEMREYAFEKMKTVDALKRGVLQTILRYGVLRFESGEDIPYVPHPNRVAKDIEQAMGLK